MSSEDEEGRSRNW